MTAEARFYFRILEGLDGTWTCRRGRHMIDEHDHLADALAHLIEFATKYAPSQVLVHYSDGRVESAAIVD